MTERFTILGHTAEVRLRLEADSYEGLFRQAAKGLLAISGVEDIEGPPVFISSVVLEAETPEELLVDWLNELIVFLFAQGRLPLELLFQSATGERLECEVHGPALPARSALSTEVKAATYHGLKIERLGGLYAATVILDV